MKRIKKVAYAIFVIAVFISPYIIVGALDRHDEQKAQEKRRVEATLYVVEVSQPKDVIELPVVPEAKAVVAEIATPVVPEQTYTDADLEMLALVIYQEAGGDACSDETRLMVGNVVLNRVADERFPDSIEEVLLQERQYGRLHWTGLVWADRASKPEEAHAVQRAYDCAKRVLEGERLLPEDVIWQAEFKQGTEVVAEQDGFYFCR